MGDLQGNRTFATDVAPNRYSVGFAGLFLTATLLLRTGAQIQRRSRPQRFGRADDRGHRQGVPTIGGTLSGVGAGRGLGSGLLHATRRDWIIAVGFGVVVVAVLAAGADRPPPAGFLVVPVMSSGLVFAVAGALPRWRLSKGCVSCFSWRGPMVQGALTGLALWLLMLALPFGGEPTIDPTLGSYLIGASVLAMLGAVCASVLAAIA